MKVTKNFTILFFLSILALPVISCCSWPKLEEDPARVAEKTQSIFLVRRTTQASVHYYGDKVGTKFEGDFSGTGVLISKRYNKSFILTANHVCQERLSNIKSAIPLAETATITINFSRIFVYDKTGKQHSTIPIVFDQDNDICILLSEKMDAKPIRLANSEPKIGEKIVSYSLPTSIWSPNFIPIFNGFYVGKIRISIVKNKVYGFSTPSRPGSSGGAVVNSSGRLVGMIHTVRKDFAHLAFCATEAQIRMNLLKAYEEYKKDEINLNLVLLII